MWEVMNTMTTREAFETEAKKHGFILDRLDKSGVYVQLITEQAWSIWKAATDAALERAAAVRTKLPPAKYGENASAPQQIYQDAFDRGWQAGISAMRGAIRALKEQQ